MTTFGSLPTICGCAFVGGRHFILGVPMTGFAIATKCATTFSCRHDLLLRCHEVLRRCVISTSFWRFLLCSRGRSPAIFLLFERFLSLLLVVSCLLAGPKSRDNFPDDTIWSLLP